MKTVLKEVIELMNQNVIKLKSEHADYFYIQEWNKMIFTAEAYLAKEKKQIKEAWIRSWADSMLEPREDRYYEPLAEEYYNETYPEKF